MSEYVGHLVGAPVVSLASGGPTMSIVIAFYEPMPAHLLAILLVWSINQSQTVE